MVEPINYDTFELDKQERIKLILMAAVVLFLVGYIFFSNIIIALLFSLGAFYYPQYKTRELIAKRKAELNLQFKEALYALSSSLTIGRSLESAFQAALRDLKILYPNENDYIIREFEYICRKISLNEPVEITLFDFAVRSGLEDIKNFAEVIAICKKSGGNLVQVAKNTANIISDKIEIIQEIDLLLTKQKFEQKILNLMPIVVIGLLKFCGFGYIDALYKDIHGYLIMLLALGILALSALISKKIFDIKV